MDQNPGIAYLDGRRLRRAFLAAAERTQALRGEMNRINVFPVPDGDTGTNLALTVRAIADHLRPIADRSVGRVAHEAAQAAVLGARGNSGMMLSHFLLGWARSVEGRDRISSQALASAFEAGVRSLEEALERPVEGTILTVMRESSEAAREAAAEPDLARVLDRVVGRARESLERTPALLPALKEAGVVDAGALGFVGMLDGVSALIRGAALPDEGAGSGGIGGSGSTLAAGEAAYPEGGEQYRFCTEALVRGDALPEPAIVRGALAEWGDSLLVIRTGDILKVHIHTDAPEAVFTRLRGWGTLVAHKAEDMRAQHAAVERAAAQHLTLARRPVSIVTDSAADLPEEIVRAHGIHVVPLLLLDGETPLRDGVDITATEFHERMQKSQGPLPTTSQPSPAAFLEAYGRAAAEGEEVLAVVLGSGLSGTFASAEAAASTFQDAPVHVVDSLGLSLLTGLLALKAAELAEHGAGAGEIAARLREIRTRSGVLVTVDRFDRLLASGRVGKGKAFLAGMLRMKPILTLDDEGKVTPAGKARGRERVLPELMRLLAEKVPPTGGRASGLKVRFGVIHVGCPEIIPAVTGALHERYGAVEILTAPATPVIATHVGTGAWALVWMRED